MKRLELLANACGHGDGESATQLFKRHPELWPDWGTMVTPLPERLELAAPILPPSLYFSPHIKLGPLVPDTPRPVRRSGTVVSAVSASIVPLYPFLLDSDTTKIRRAANVI